MKSQDIVLLLTLVSLSQRENQVPPLIPENWEGWDDHALLDEDFPYGQEMGIAYESSGEPRGEFSNATDDQAATLFEAEKRYDPYSVRALSASTGISKSEVSMVLKRCYTNGLARQDRLSGVPRVNTKSLYEFIVYGLRYVFPAKPGEVTRGIATGLAAPVLHGQLMTAGDLVPVWPDARGNTKGAAVEPLFKTVPMAVRRDSTLYAYLALVDAIRMGQPRERNFAAQKLETLLKD